VAQGEAPYIRRPSLHAVWREAEVACLPLREPEHTQLGGNAALKPDGRGGRQPAWQGQVLRGERGIVEPSQDADPIALNVIQRAGHATDDSRAICR
jgi:hypothetical protein